MPAVAPVGGGQSTDDGCCTLVCWLKSSFWPIILIAQSIRIYFLGALGVYLDRLGRGIGFGLCVCCGRTYSDKTFPPTAASIGTLNGKSLQQVQQEVQWKRIQNICAISGKAGAKLFAGDIHPSDICQGQLGDCWLMSAIACLADCRGAVQEVFITKEYNAYGRYKIRMYDKPAAKWVYLKLDDWIPVDAKKGQCIFAKPNADEAWVLLLEKAMAKFKGTYAALDGGSPLWALEVLTGDFVFKLQQDKKAGAFRRLELVHILKKDNGPRAYDVGLRDMQDNMSPDDAFQTLLLYKRKGAVIGAGTNPGSDKENTNGIVHGHAYSLIRIKEVASFKLLQLRNPWGSFEWTGNWSDSSPLWKQYPKVARALDFKVSDDGTFWMEWKDCLVYFQSFDVCCKTTGWDSLALDIHEEHPCCGPMVGCAEGCCSYWFCCRGFHALFCGRKVQKFEKLKRPNCLGC